MPIAIFIQRILSKKHKAIRSVLNNQLVLPDYMTPTKTHRELLKRLTKDNQGKVKEVYKSATNELMIKQGPYIVSAEIEDGIIGCYCCYRHDKLLETIYPEDVNGLHWLKHNKEI